METEIKIKIRHQGTVMRMAIEGARSSEVQGEAEPWGSRTSRTQA